jgi:ADP-ribosyl-[dinitrogen reductase] hydrolase
MALCLADSLIANNGPLDPNDLAMRFARWWRQGENSVAGSCFDIGGATRSALASFEQTGVARGSDHLHAAGNGGIMRLAPVAVAARGDPARAAALARAESGVTHTALECLDSAEALALILCAGIAGEERGALEAGARASLAAAKVRAIAEGAFRGKSRRDIRSSGYVVDTLEAALWAVSESRTFEEAVLMAVNLGDDADTVGAVARQVAGSVWGMNAIPERWRRQVAWSDRLLETADALWRTAR